MKHSDRLKCWHPDDEQTRTLRYLVEHRRRLVGDRTRLSNRLTSLLKCYFPQLLWWFPDLSTVLVCDFLLRWPALDSAAAQRLTHALYEAMAARFATMKGQPGRYDERDARYAARKARKK